MTKLILSGCNGRMGRVVAELCRDDPEISLAAGIDPLGVADGLPCSVFPTPQACTVAGDVLVDFSVPAALTSLLDFALARGLPTLLATTGYTPDQLAQIQEASLTLPIFRSANLSLGINLLLELTRRCAQVLGEEFDIEIVERHHNKKMDAPSGTALMLADAAREGLSFTPQYVYDRHSRRQIRDHTEIGISSIRGGSIPGDHQVIFAGEQEVVELCHHAGSREVFARGALRAAKFMAGVHVPRLYDMRDVLVTPLNLQEASPL